MATIRCPQCGQRFTTTVNRSKTFESSARAPFKNTAALPIPAPAIQRQSTSYLPSMEANVHVPANQAIITGCLFAPVVGLTFFTIVTIGKASTGDAILIGLIAGGIALFATATWQWLAKTSFYDSLLQQIETELGFDLDGDGEIGPTAIKTEVRVNNNWIYADLPHDRGNEKALVDFLASVIAGTVTFSERGAVTSGYNVDRFKDLRAVFIKHGFAYRKGKADNSPIVFTVSGNALMRDVVNTPPPENYEMEADRGMSAHYVERRGKRESWG